jgi:hypothetical protein
LLPIGLAQTLSALGCSSTYNNILQDLQRTITSQGTYELRVDMEDFENNIRYANFTTFSVGDSSTKYRLTISGYSGDAGIATNWDRTEVVYSWLFKYIQQHTAGFTENNRAPHLLMPAGMFHGFRCPFVLIIFIYTYR